MKGKSLVLILACTILCHVAAASTIKDIKVTYTSPCSLDVTWTSDCTKACKYDVSYTGPFNSSLTATDKKAVIASLPAGDYVVCVVAENNTRSVPPVCGKATVKAEAPGAVQDMKSTANPRNITVTWTAATENNCTADTDGYMLTLQNGTSKQSFNVSSGETDKVFLNLEPCMEYTVTVDVLSKIATSSSGKMNVSTSIEAPTEPAFTVMDVSPTSLQVNWTASPASACSVTNYIVKWVTADGKTPGNITLGANITDYTIVNLTQASTYSVSVLAVATYDKATADSASKPLNVSTCGPVTSLEHSKQNVCGTVLSWVNSCKESYNYTITWRGPLNGSVDTEKDIYIFTDLPTGQYTFSVNSTYDPKDFTPLNVTIEEEAAGKVQNVTFAETPTILTVAWEAPAKLACSAAPSGYNVSLLSSIANSTAQINSTKTTDMTFVNLEPCSDFIVSVITLSAKENVASDNKTASTLAEAPVKPVVSEVEIMPETLLVNWTSAAVGNCPISNFTVKWKAVATNSTSNVTFGSDKTSYTISKLTESSAYDISVVAITDYQNKSLSTESDPVPLSTCGTIISLNKTEQNACGFTLSWENNCTMSYNYTISWTGQLVGNVSINSTSHDFPELPAGKYSFCVSSTYNAADFRCLNTTVVPEAPEKVQDVKFTQTARNLSVMWTPSKNKSCTVPTKGYALTLLKASNHSVNMSMTVASNLTNFTFTKLEPCTEYAVSVDAISSVANTSSGIMNESTSVEAPSAPAVTVVGFDPKTFNVDWSVPNLTACPITGYFVEWMMLDGTTLGNATFNNTQTKATLNFTEASTYTLSATAISSFDKVTLNSTASLNISSCAPVVSLKNSKQSQCSTTLSWENSCAQSFDYIITWEGTLNGSLNTNLTNNTFSNLPSGQYAFSVNSSWNPLDLMYLNVTIKDEAPGKVKDVKFAPNSRLLTVAWTPAETYKCTTPTTGYMVYLQKNVNGSKIMNATVPKDSSFSTFKELDPCTEYEASIEVLSAVANVTSGNMTSSTLIEAPGKPNITVTNHTADSILVKWTKSMANPCPIDEYLVTWRVKGASKGGVAKVSSKESSYKIKSLKHKTTYGINVTAHVSYQNTTKDTTSSELMETTDGGSSRLGNIFLVNIFLIAIVRLCN